VRMVLHQHDCTETGRPAHLHGGGRHLPSQWYIRDACWATVLRVPSRLIVAMFILKCFTCCAPLHSKCLSEHQEGELEGLGPVRPVLANTLNPPSSEAVDKALEHLRLIGAINEAEELTPLGQHLAKLPVGARLTPTGRVNI
jgi:Helicase associated domain (HA2)